MATLTVRTPHPVFVERARAVDTVLRVGGGTLTAATYDLLDHEQTAIVDDRAATVAGSGPYTATVALVAGDVPATLDFSQAYEERWTLTVDGDTHVVRRPCWLVRFSLRPAIDDSDLEARHPGITNLKPAAWSDWAEVRDKAFETVVRRLIREGLRPDLVLDASQVVDAHVSKALAMGFRGMATNARGGGSYISQAEHYEEEHEADFAALRLDLDLVESGKQADADRGEPGVGVLFLTSSDSNRSRWI